MKIQRNGKGYRVGQCHHRAKLTDVDVALIFELRMQGLSIVAIARKMECGRTTVYKIIRGMMRNQAIEEVRYLTTPYYLKKPVL